MIQADIDRLRELVADARRWLNGNGNGGNGGDDSCVMGQWNTFQYVAKAEDTLKWADVKQLRPVVQKLSDRAEYIREFIDTSNRFLNVIEELAEKYDSYQGEVID